MDYNPIICAIDTIDQWKAGKIARDLRGSVGAIKLGLEFYTSNGRLGIQQVVSQNTPLFLDLKFHDIPNTVAGAVMATSGMQVTMMTVHAAGGREMLKRAVEASNEIAENTGSIRPMILGVTVLTSMDDTDLLETGVAAKKAADQVLRLAELAESCQVDGIVCSPHEISAVRKQCSQDFKIVTPGIRPSGSVEKDDQKRIMTPKEAIERGADYLVIGRPITQAENPVAAAKEILASLD